MTPDELATVVREALSNLADVASAYVISARPPCEMSHVNAVLARGRDAVLALAAQVATLEAALFACYVAAGADTDGARQLSDMGRIDPSIDVLAVKAVASLRRDSDEGQNELEAERDGLLARATRLEETLQDIAGIGTVGCSNQHNAECTGDTRARKKAIVALTDIGSTPKYKQLLDSRSGLLARTRKLEEALRAIAEAAEPEGCNEKGCGHSDAGLGHRVCGCYADSGPHLDHFCGWDDFGSIARAALADTDSE